jgi:hypothetical protein
MVDGTSAVGSRQPNLYPKVGSSLIVGSATKDRTQDSGDQHGIGLFGTNTNATTCLLVSREPTWYPTLRVESRDYSVPIPWLDELTRDPSSG